MSDPDDLMARGRAIFERLRTAETERSDPLPPTEVEDPGDTGERAPDGDTDEVAVSEHPTRPASDVADVTSAPPAPAPATDERRVDADPAEVDAAEPFPGPPDADEDHRDRTDGVGASRSGDDAEPSPAASNGGWTGVVSIDEGDPSPAPDDVADAQPWAVADAEVPDDRPMHEPQPADQDVLPAAPPSWAPAGEPPAADIGEPAPADVVATVDAPERPHPTVPHADPVAAPPELDELLEETGVEDRSSRPVGASPFARDLPRILAIANQKGGVGKTTTAVNLGACLADLGYRVLVIDLDPQGNASTGLGINIRALQASMYDVIINDFPLEDCIEATTVRNLFVAPASLDLAGAEIELVPAFSRELKLRRALEDVVDDYDFVLVDCPPSLGLLTVNGLAAAGEVLVPIQCEYYALEGLGQLLRNVNLVQKNLNARLELSAIVLVMYDARTKLADQVVREVRSHFGDKVCRNIIPRTVRLSEAPSFGQPIIAFDSSSRGAIAYRELAKEVSGGTPQRAR